MALAITRAQCHPISAKVYVVLRSNASGLEQGGSSRLQIRRVLLPHDSWQRGHRSQFDGDRNRPPRRTHQWVGHPSEGGFCGVVEKLEALARDAGFSVLPPGFTIEAVLLVQRRDGAADCALLTRCHKPFWRRIPLNFPLSARAHTCEVIKRSL